MSNAYLMPAEFHQVEETIKNSRFITQIYPVQSAQQAKDIIKEVKERFPDARHHCSAFVGGAPYDFNQMGFSDDGEPSGTAGKPMLAVLQGAKIGHILAVSIRYFGGVKLGTGGLVKAYAGGVKLALNSLVTSWVIPKQKYTLLCDYPQFDQIQYWLNQEQADILETQYSDKIELLLALTDTSSDNLQTKLNDLQLSLQPLEQK
ncbi:YigZ family protein [Catenovulum sp. 2E275]|uniref:YigZ family protein n=1 Tax=Catenovulum sp. 2E275 TaxID=2980497 RepID=UPI0021D23A59|nr:YigZ family protein [Catenovulum sp. 2E275]MCU4675869.1 YigZ family protein [Catenovulum sp. 2E275]